MQGKTIGVFSAGFASGLLCLAILLGSTGRLPVAKAAPPLKQLHLASERPDISLADRIPPSDLKPARLLMPIQGQDPTLLPDSFNDARGRGKHEALDIPAPRGTPIHAVAQGNIAKLFTSKQGGLTVYQFDDTGVWCYYYAHLDRYAPGLKEGLLLRQGDVLGYVGTTGNAPPQTPHLHFAVFRLGPEKNWWQGQAIDPLPLFK